MNFFKAQDEARKRTFRLIVLLAIAVTCLILITNIVVMLALEYKNIAYIFSAPHIFIELFSLETFLYVSLGVSSVIFFASMLKLLQLSQGGRVVAESLGGQAIPFNSHDTTHQKILNVVEEMAIASGSHVPVVYLIENQNINAFAAGWNHNDAVIGITRGAVEKLNRNELQGVIAHEFSHIMNGDMRLNIQLTGVLHGIEAISFVGRGILHAMGAGGRHSSSRNNSRSSSSGSGLFAIGLLAFTLLAIGYIGSLFGNLIKSNISRHREYLADASAVQFTRNPSSIANALKKIGGIHDGSILNISHADEYSHFFFASSINNTWFSGFDSHPPLDERIRRIEPYWDGKYIAPKIIDKPLVDKTKAEKNKQAAATVGMTAAIIETLNNIGSPASQQHIELAQQLLQEIPDALHLELKDPYGVRAAIYALLLNDDMTLQKKQLFHVNKHADKGVYEHIAPLRDLISQLHPRLRLALIDIAIPTLRELSLKQYRLFRVNARALMNTDQQIDFKEWILRRILFNHLDEAFNLRKRPASRYAYIGAVKHAAEIILSQLVYLEHHNKQEAEMAFLAALKSIGAGALNIVAREELNTQQLDDAMNELEQLKPLLKQRLIKAAAAGLTYNNHVTIEGYELLRALASDLQSPMPPILPTK